MSQKPVFLTPEGLAKLEDELEHLRNVRRPEIAQKIHRAMEMGSIANDPEYEDAKNEQGFVEGRILTLEKIINNAAIISKEEAPPEWVKLGAKVRVINQDGDSEEFTIVGSAEANPSMGTISNESPVGKALLGRRVGEEIQVLVPAGVLRFTVVAIE